MTIGKLTLKNKTATEWTSANPTLDKGEIGIENDTGKFKLGDSTTEWKTLPYAAMTVAEITAALAGKADTTAIPPVVDNLTSTSTTSALSANQGRALNDKIPAVVNSLTETTAGKALDATQGKALKEHYDGIAAINTIAVS